jgi:OmpA-OmpF porin, OOP family
MTMKQQRMMLPALAVAFGGAAIVAGCAAPTETAGLRQAESSVQTARADPSVQKYASVDLMKSEEALQLARNASTAEESEAEVDHLAYLAQQRAAIAQAKGQAGASRAQIEQLGKQRPEILLQAEKQRTAALEQQLHARQTERGTMVTLGDVLFDTGQSSLKPGAQAELSRLADYLKERPNASVIVEGHTDSRGSPSTNLALSERRAEAVRSALVVNGVDAARIVARGLGESMPVASNRTAAGRQQNRRVDVVVQ